MKHYVLYKSAKGDVSGRSRLFKTKTMAELQAKSLSLRGYAVSVTNTDENPLPTHTKKTRVYSRDLGENLLIR